MAIRTFTQFSCAALLGACLVALPGCRPPAGDEVAAPPDTRAARKPAQAVRQLTAHLRANELEAFAMEAVPPEMHERLVVAWSEGRTRWPLDELPFGRRLPAILAALSAPGSEKQLQQTFDRQFAGAGRELRSAAQTLGVFGTRYVAEEGDYSEDERLHYTQLIAAASQWGMEAPLGDRNRAGHSIAQLAAAARRTGLASAADFREAGMAASLRKLGPFAAAFKVVLLRYGLDLNADLATLDASLQQQTGDQARVRMRYRFAGADIDTVVSLRRIDERWYVEDFLRHAEAAIARPLPPAPVPDPADAAPAQAQAAPATTPRR
ncbi:hypothetical protein QAA18_07570 [Luteimonas sp. 8-5]|uniref:hypothetical protein n=1 Tax=Luteimonas sp. 8-5 TaxID=3039387 RepID=UPI0024370249|nr:hypothetical protein [Luteimonas sp. 8-5]MDG6348601.1 hypothetical protein [Luteimonas sp. 8-5]